MGCCATMHNWQSCPACIGNNPLSTHLVQLVVVQMDNVCGDSVKEVPAHRGAGTQG